jgi:type IV pilus assembly protein PilV
MIRKEESGFSLIESMISIVILSIGLVGVTKMQLSMTAATQLARQRVEALSMASTKLEVIRHAGTCIAETPGPITPYQGSATYATVIACTSTKLPVVTVTWNDASGATNNVTLRTS